MKHRDTQKHLAEALGRIASGLFVVTARRADVQTGMLASWVQQCSFEPPQITVAIQKGRHIAALLKDGAAFALNILDESQTDMIIHFGRGFALDEDAFAGLDIQHPNSGPPVLSEALGYLDCKVAGRFPAGDHDLFLAKVTGGKLLNNGHPMVHVRKSGLHY